MGSCPYSHMTPWSLGIVKSRDKLKHISTITMPLATKLRRMVTYLNGLLPIRSNNCLITWSCKVTLQTKIIIFTTRVPLATKLCRMVTYLNGLLPIKSNNCLITWSCKITLQTKIIIFTTRVPMATKLGRMVTYLDGLLPIKSHDPFIIWSCGITWQSKYISPLSQCLSPPKLADWWLPLTFYT